MKKLILFSVLIIATVQFTFAQNTIAKLKFEEAEEAYTNNNFELTLTKLNEVETLLKATNPRILYLQILAQSKIIEKNPLGDYVIIENARNSINKYLKDYENLPDNEDKYREIYKISESFVKYPATKQDFDLALETNRLKAEADRLEQKKKIEAEVARQINVLFEKSKEEQRINLNASRFIDSLCANYHFKRGLTKAEFISFNPEASRIITRLNKVREYNNEIIYANLNVKMGIYYIVITDGIVTQVYLKIFNENGFSQSDLFFSNLLKDVKKNIPSQNLQQSGGSIDITDKNFKITFEESSYEAGTKHHYTEVEIRFIETK